MEEKKVLDDEEMKEVTGGGLVVPKLRVAFKCPQCGERVTANVTKVPTCGKCRVQMVSASDL